MERTLRTKIIIAVISMAVAAVSFFVAAEPLSSVEIHEETISHLDEKSGTVMELTAASAAASAAITLLPGDTATPIADKFADFSSYFLVVICAIYLEKYLTTVTFYVALKWLIPIACILFAVTAFWEKEVLKNAARKLLIFGILIPLVVPASTGISRLIDRTYSSSIEATIEAAKEAAEETESAAEEKLPPEEEQGFVSGIFNKVKEGVSGVAELPKKFEQMLNRFIEAFAVMMVTSCLIPVLVLFFFLSLAKSMLGGLCSAPVRMPQLPSIKKSLTS